MTFLKNQTMYQPELATIRQQLHEAIDVLECPPSVALLDHPNHPNVGDSLIWLGEVFYFTQTQGAQVGYMCNRRNFSPHELEKQVGSESPIFLHGGGNFGDVWPFYQKFRENIIERYPDRPIVILPQTIFFKDTDNIAPIARLFNDHGKITIFVRDNYSYEIATKHFHNCRVFKAPDMAFEMVGIPAPKLLSPLPKTPLYLSRKDQEANISCDFSHLGISDLVVEDWAAYKYYYADTPRAWTPSGWRRVARETKRQGTLLPWEWISRQLWKYLHSYSKVFKDSYGLNAHLKSWCLMHHGVYQLLKYSPVITNRLHGHITCVIFGIPHVFLPNSYYKNKGFYEAWTHTVPYCRFIEDPRNVRDAVMELSELYP